MVQMVYSLMVSSLGNDYDDVCSLYLLHYFHLDLENIQENYFHSGQLLRVLAKSYHRIHWRTNRFSMDQDPNGGRYSVRMGSDRGQIFWINCQVATYHDRNCARNVHDDGRRGRKSVRVQNGSLVLAQNRNDDRNPHGVDGWIDYERVFVLNDDHLRGNRVWNVGKVCFARTQILTQWKHCHSLLLNSFQMSSQNWYPLIFFLAICLHLKQMKYICIDKKSWVVGLYAERRLEKRKCSLWQHPSSIIRRIQSILLLFCRTNYKNSWLTW